MAQEKRKTIAIDIDDVLAAEAEFIIAYSNAWQTNLQITDYTENWRGMWGVNQDEAERRAAELHRPGIESSYRLIPGSRPVLEKLAKRYNLIVVTSRRHSVAQETVDWLDKNFGGLFQDIHFANIWDDGHVDAHLRTKAELCIKLGADYLVDDQLKHCLAVAVCNTTAILFGDYPWNQNDKALPVGVRRAKDWQAVGRFFDE
jgi:5'(3')-deoxyribonucleotidase